MSIELYDFQKQAVKFHVERPYSLNFYEQGLGKSAIALSTFKLKKLNRLAIVCPSYLQQNWKNEILKWEISSKTFVVSYSSLKIETILEFEPDFFIFDECHYLKNPQTARSKRVMTTLSAVKPKGLIGLTGTPIRKDVDDLYNYFSLVRDKSMGTIWDFRKKYMNEKYDPYSHSGVKYTGFDPSYKVELIKKLNKISIKKRTDQVIDLPKQNFIEHAVANKKLKQLSEEILEMLNSKDEIHFQTLKKQAAFLKTEHTLKLVIDLNKKCVVFTDHVSSCTQLGLLLSTKYVVDGSTPGAKRAEIVEQFEKEDKGILVATMGALSTGVNLTSCETMIFNDFNYSYSTMAQAQKRIHRIGQNKPCFYYYVMESTLDKKIMDKVWEKQKLHEGVIDGY